MKRIPGLGLLLILSGCATQGVDRADVNTPIEISYALVSNIEHVQLQSDVGKNAAVGGILGLAIGAIAGGDAADAAIGAATGAALSASTTKIQEGSDQAVSYTLERPNGSEIKVVTEDVHLQVGDCAAVESGVTTNLRRVAADMCHVPLQHPVEQELASNAQSEANDCNAAKKQLLDASSNVDIEAASKKVRVLCQ
jgi:outer membrane lipoprotein SlyB